MSDLDQAIRDRLAVVRGHMTMHRAAQIDDSVDPLFNDAGELGAAVVAVLDLHKPHAPHLFLPDDFRCAGCSNHVVRVDYPCATVLGIANALGVSGEDRSEPTPAPGDTVRLHLADGTVITGRLYLDPEDDDRERVEDEHGCGWLVEVNGRRRKVEAVSSEGTS